MLRIEQEKGAYQLATDQQIQITENNPMLTDEGSKSLPVTLSSSEHNLALLGQPHRIGRREKYVSRHKFVLNQGVFRKTGTHVVFSASKSTGIQTTFYLREGELYTEIKNTTLPEIDWGAPLDPFTGTTEEKTNNWLSHFAKVMQGIEEKEYCVFPVITKYEEKPEEESSGRGGNIPVVELINMPDKDGNLVTNDKFGEIEVLRGYGVTCFLRLSFVLEKIFAHFGYSLKPSLWHTDNDYKKLVVLNNTADAITSGKLYYSHLVPTCEVDKFLECVKKKFNCAFDIDEEKRTVEFSFLDTVLEQKPEKDLTPYIDGELDEITFNEYKQVKLSASTSLSFAAPDSETYNKFRKKYSKIIEVTEEQFSSSPASIDTVYFRKAYGAYYKKVINVDHKIVITRVSSCYFPHNQKEGNNLEDYSTDDQQIPVMGYPVYLYGTLSVNLPCPFVGDRRHANTTLKVNGVLQEAEKQDMGIMFCFSIGKIRLSATIQSAGSTSNISYDFYMGTPFEYNNKGEKWGNASLRYQGDCGLFQRFFKRTDAVMRNAFSPVSCKLHLPQSELLKLRFTNLYLIQGQPVLIYNNQYTLTNNGIYFDNTEFRTTRLLEPVELYKEEGLEGGDKDPIYYWEMKTNIDELKTKHDSNIAYWVYWIYTGAKPNRPTAPTEAQLEQGGRYHSATFNIILYGQQTEAYRPNLGVSFTDKLQVWYEPRVLVDINRVVLYWQEVDNADEICAKYFKPNSIAFGGYTLKNKKPPLSTDLDAVSFDDFLTGKKMAEDSYDVKLLYTIFLPAAVSFKNIDETIKIWFEPRFKII